MKYESLELINEFVSLYNRYLPASQKPQNLYHYTSLSILFKIIEGDALWFSNTRFSNDSSEEKMIDDNCIYFKRSTPDNYLFCFCGDSDQLSQWRGYCCNGGVSISLDFANTQKFSILHKDYNISRKYELCYNRPLPVTYIGDSNQIAKNLINVIEDEKDRNQFLSEVLPYVKNENFIEENEARLVFGNVDNCFAKCIQYRDIGNNTKVPYMVVKSGDIGADKSSCMFDIGNITEENLIKRTESLEYEDKLITIPQGYNQEAVFSKVNSLVEKVNEKSKAERKKIKIFCEGHIPIRKIIVSPMQNKERIKEQIEHYCRSKYWLRYVDVELSDIPYVSTLNK